MSSNKGNIAIPILVKFPEDSEVFMIIATINGGIKEQQLLHGIIRFPNI